MDESSQIIVSGYYKNIPHINTSKWREAALHFQEHERYTNLPPNSHPSSRYYKFWEEEARRSVFGYHVDGDWIPGYFYFYLNYCPIYKSIETDHSDREIVLEDLMHQAQAERISEFPDFWDGDYQTYHYYDEAEKSGEHGVILKTRGRGYSFKAASMCLRNYYLIPGSKSYVFADDKAFLIEDGTLSKAWEMMDHIESHTPWGKRRQRHDSILYKRASYYVDHGGLKIEKGFKSEIIGVSLKNNWNKAHPYSSNIITPDGIKKWRDIKIGDKIFGKNGDIISVIDVQERGMQDVYKISFNDGRSAFATDDHLWDIVKWNNGRKGSNRETKILRTKELIDILNGPSVVTNSLKIELNKKVEFDHKPVPLDAYVLGLMLGDGSINKTTNNQSPITLKHDDLDSVKKYIPYDIRHEKWGGDIRNVIFIPNGRAIFKSLYLFDKTCDKKFIPDIYKFNSSTIRINILNGLLDTDGSVTNDYGVIEYATKSYQLAKDVIWIVHSLGYGGIIKNKIVKNNIYYRCYIYCNKLDNNLFNLERKKQRILNKKCNEYALNKVNYITIKSIEYSHKEECKCITVDALDSLYLIEDFIPTHNSRGKRGKLLIYEEGGKFPNLLSSWNMSLKSMQQGRLTHGLQVCFGTGGTEGEDFIGLEQLFYEGKAWNVHQVRNKWDEGVQNSNCGHFVSVEQNMEGAMDRDGNSLYDISSALVTRQRDKVIKNTKNPEAIVRFIAEEPRTPQEAVMRIGGTIFPINDLKAHRNYLQANPEKFEETEYIGVLDIDPETEKIKWKPDNSVRPIRKFPEMDKHYLEGAIVIYEHPVLNPDGTIPYGIYIAGNDPYDHDESTTDSLGSTFIFNRLTQRIVAEYTGRPATANEYYENVRRLLIYYNARCNYENNLKGLFTYLNNRHSAHYLCDIPRLVADKIYDKSLLNRGKGTPGTEPIQKWGRELILIWLTTPVEKGSEILNLHKIRSIPLLQELIYWNSKGNFDRISALQMLMILNEDMQHIQVDEEFKPHKLVSPFFARMEMFKEKLQEKNDPFASISKRYELEKRIIKL